MVKQEKQASETPQAVAEKTNTTSQEDTTKQEASENTKATAAVSEETKVQTEIAKEETKESDTSTESTNENSKEEQASESSESQVPSHSFDFSNMSDAEKKEHYTKQSAKRNELLKKKQDISRKIVETIKNVRRHKQSRDALNERIQQFKEERDEKNAIVQDLISKAKVLNEKREKIAPTHTQQSGSAPLHPRKIKQLEEELKKTSIRLETEAVSFEGEKKMMKRMKEIKKELAKGAQGTEVFAELSVLNKQIKEAKKEASVVHKSIQETAERSEEKHKQVVDISKEVDVLKKDEEIVDKELAPLQAECAVLEKDLKIVAQQSMLQKKKDDRKKQRKEEKKQQKKLDERTSEAESKLKNKQKLTMDDLLALQASKNSKKIISGVVDGSDEKEDADTALEEKKEE